MSYGGDTTANAMLPGLVADADFTIPDVDLSGINYPDIVDDPLFQAVPRITNADLTTQAVGGTGVFDILMTAMKAHLVAEYEKGRITGAEYTKAYTALMEQAMGGAVQFLLARDQSFWQAKTAQMQALTARIGIETAKVQLAAIQLEAYTAKANYALTKLNLAKVDAEYGAAKFQVDNILPKQQVLVTEQGEAQRAQTMNTRSDGVTTVTGSIGKQKDLYSQQITSYQRDAEVKAGKIFADAWTVQKTVDEGLLAPGNFQNASIDTVLGHIKTNNNLA